MNTVQLNLIEPTEFYAEKWVISARGKLWNHQTQSFCEGTWLLGASIFSTKEEGEKCLKKIKKILKKTTVSTVCGRMKLSELAEVRKLKPFEQNIINNNIEGEKIRKGEID